MGLNKTAINDNFSFLWWSYHRYIVQSFDGNGVARDVNVKPKQFFFAYQFANFFPLSIFFLCTRNLIRKSINEVNLNCISVLSFLFSTQLNGQWMMMRF